MENTLNPPGGESVPLGTAWPTFGFHIRLCCTIIVPLTLYKKNILKIPFDLWQQGVVMSMENITNPNSNPYMTVIIYPAKVYFNKAPVPDKMQDLCVCYI